MSLNEFDKHSDPKVRAWAMIWKVANELQGICPESEESRKIILEIGRLRSEGLLSKMQETVLDRMGENASLDFEF